ncbi:MAG: hypothetical protein V4492_02500, partial [Chlamydiota bacterium]
SGVRQALKDSEEIREAISSELTTVYQKNQDIENANERLRKARDDRGSQIESIHRDYRMEIDEIQQHHKTEKKKLEEAIAGQNAALQQSGYRIAELEENLEYSKGAHEHAKAEKTQQQENLRKAALFGKQLLSQLDAANKENAELKQYIARVGESPAKQESPKDSSAELLHLQQQHDLLKKHSVALFEEHKKMAAAQASQIDIIQRQDDRIEELEQELERQRILHAEISSTFSELEEQVIKSYN